MRSEQWKLPACFVKLKYALRSMRYKIQYILKLSGIHISRVRPRVYKTGS